MRSLDAPAATGRAIWILLASCSHGGDCPCGAQQWPAKPITIVNGFPAGAGTDIVLRMFQEALEKDLGHATGVRVQAGRRRQRRLRVRRQGAPDGYTLMIGTAGTHGINAALYKKLAFDVEADFTPIAPLADVPNVLTVNPSAIDAKSVKEFIAAVKAAPGKFNYGSTGNGASTHLGFAQFNAAAGLDMVHVPYKGSPEAMQAMVTGEMCCMFAQLQTVLGQWRAGKVRLLGRQHQGARRHPRRCADGRRSGAAGLRERHLVRPDRAQGPRSRRSPSASTPPCARPRRTRPCARSSPASARLVAQRDARAVPCHGEGRPSQVGRDRQGLRRQDRLSPSRRRSAWSDEAGASAGAAGGPLVRASCSRASAPSSSGSGADYSLGVPSRIGPGYVPRLLGMLLAGHRPVPGRALAGGRPRRRYHGRLAARVLVLGAVVAFALVFEATGLVPAILVSVAVANYATPENRWTTARRPRRDARLFCLGAVRQGPVAAAAGLAASERSGAEPDVRLRRRRDAAEPAVLPDRRVARHAGRRAAGSRAGRHHRHAAAGDLHAAARSRRSSCWPGSTTGPSTAAPPPRSSSTFPAKAPLSSPASTGT